MWGGANHIRQKVQTGLVTAWGLRYVRQDGPPPPPIRKFDGGPCQGTYNPREGLMINALVNVNRR